MLIDNIYIVINLDGIQQQLLMCVPAAAGTGKSHLIKALTEYFKTTDRITMLRKLAPTSNAANEMGEGGLTMQSFLHCHTSVKRKKSIESDWKHVKYVFMDEVSMIGLDSITKLSRLMHFGKEEWADSTHPFGGKNIVFFGDLIQFKPIMDAAVYVDVFNKQDHSKSAAELYKFYETDIFSNEQHNINEENESKNINNNYRSVSKSKVSNALIRKRIGRAIWLQINTVVILSKQMRTVDQELYEIQNRVRFGVATAEDHKVLSKRVIKSGNIIQSLANSPWNAAPIIVFRNNLKNGINNRAVVRKSIEDNTPLIVCVANDTFSKNSIQNRAIVHYTLNLDDNKTENLPGYLPLVKGIKFK